MRREAYKTHEIRCHEMKHRMAVPADGHGGRRTGVSDEPGRNRVVRTLAEPVGLIAGCCGKLDAPATSVIAAHTGRTAVAVGLRAEPGKPY